MDGRMSEMNNKSETYRLHQVMKHTDRKELGGGQVPKI